MRFKLLVKAAFILWGISIVAAHLVASNHIMASVTLTSSGFVLHCAGFFVGMVLCWLAFDKKNISFILWAGLLLLISSIILEGVHYYLPYRTFNVYDIVANGVGIGLFVVVYVVYAGVKKRGLGEMGVQRSEVHGSTVQRVKEFED
jgi:glycopeptide antibiotics resistance protein